MSFRRPGSGTVGAPWGQERGRVRPAGGGREVGGQPGCLLTSVLPRETVISQVKQDICISQPSVERSRSLGERPSGQIIRGGHSQPPANSDTTHHGVTPPQSSFPVGAVIHPWLATSSSMQVLPATDTGGLSDLELGQSPLGNTLSQLPAKIFVIITSRHGSIQATQRRVL
ncbi:hypothetical protein BaRGS_00028811 [Batillaria attramentaria]|uniref:Uncharacterized protein n=1 Tax=Batillaria attramentaria TaxID=370345 RepID=A0ABD0JZ38_9CAEN